MITFITSFPQLRVAGSYRRWLFVWAVVTSVCEAMSAADTALTPKVPVLPSVTPMASTNSQAADPRSLRSQFRARLAAEVLKLAQDWEALGKQSKASSTTNSAAKTESLKVAATELRARTVGLLTVLKPIIEEIEAIPLQEIPSYLEIEVERRGLLAMKSPKLSETTFRPASTNVSVIFIRPRMASATSMRMITQIIQEIFDFGEASNSFAASELPRILRDLHFDLDPMTSRGIELISSGLQKPK